MLHGARACAPAVLSICYFVFGSGLMRGTDSLPLGCIESLELPSYDLAHQSSATGEVIAMLEFQPDRRAKVETFGKASPILHDVLKRAIGRSTLLPACQGETIRLVFDFRIEGAPMVKPAVTYRVEPPNRIRVTGRPAIPNI